MEADWRTPRIFLEWGAAVACIITLLAGKDSIQRSAVMGLVVCGSLAASFAVHEHGWMRAPRWLGAPIRPLILLGLIWGVMGGFGYYVWPPEPSYVAMLPRWSNEHAKWQFLPTARGKTQSRDVKVTSIFIDKFLPVKNPPPNRPWAMNFDPNHDWTEEKNLGDIDPNREEFCRSKTSMNLLFRRFCGCSSLSQLQIGYWRNPYMLTALMRVHHGDSLCM